MNDAAPCVEMSPKDASRFNLAQGDRVQVQSRRGSVEGTVRLGDIAEGHLFIPFHYGYWDDEEGDHRRAANELTLTGWDPVSKQPHFKFAAVRLDHACA